MPEAPLQSEGLSLDGFRRVAFQPASGRFVMVVNPKAACSTFKYSVWQAEHAQGLTPHKPPPRSGGAIHRRNNNPITHLDLGRFASELGRVPVYAVVRNPYTRLLSAYMDKIAGDRKEKRQLLLGMGYTFNRPISFDAFVEHVAATASPDLDTHWAPQTWLMQNRFLAYDAIGAVEDLATFLEPLLERHYGMVGAMASYRPHSTGASALLERYYTPRLIDLVLARFADDFALLGYPEDPARAGEPPSPPPAPPPSPPLLPKGTETFGAALAVWTLLNRPDTLFGRWRRRNEGSALLAATPQEEPGLALLAGRLALDLNRPEDAEPLLRRAVAAGNLGAQAAIALSRCLARQRRWEAAAQVAEAALDSAGLHVSAVMVAARAAEGAGRRGEALRYEALAALGPQIDLPKPQRPAGTPRSAR